MCKGNDEWKVRRKKFVIAALIILIIPIVAGIFTAINGAGLKGALVTLPVVAIYYVAYIAQYVRERRSWKSSRRSEGKG